MSTTNVIAGLVAVGLVLFQSMKSIAEDEVTEEN